MFNNDSSNTPNKELTAETKAGIGILLGVVAAAGLAAVYLYGTTSGESQRKQLNKRLKGVKKDVVAELKKLQKVDKQVYLNIIDDVVSRYQQMGEVDAEELITFGKELKGHYATIRKEAEKVPAKRKSTKQTGKKGAKKTGKKASKQTTQKTSTPKKKSPPKNPAQKISASKNTTPSPALTPAPAEDTPTNGAERSA
ncbi:MAG: hypothetical protein WDZ79_01890 [Candidatus Paceibacterota bacterium]